MKKIVLLMMMCFLIGKTFATPTSYYYCGANGNCFYVHEFYYANGTMGFTCQYAGLCTGGPFVFSLLPLSPQDPLTSSVAEASTNVYATFSGTPGGDYTPTGAEIAAADSAHTSASYVWVNPANINWAYAKIFAQQLNWSAFALSVIGNPVHNTLNFDVYSTSSQTVSVSLYNTTTAHVDWSTSLSLSEGKNEIRNQNVTGYTGSYVLRISASTNTINRNVTLN